MTTRYTIHDYTPGVDVSTTDPDVAEYWSREKGRDVTAVTTA